MDVQKFILPELKTDFDVELAMEDTHKQLRSLFRIAFLLIAFFLIMCYISTTLTTFLIWMGLSALGLLGLWTFHRRVGNTERQRAESKTFLPAEELVLDHHGFHWAQRGPQPNHVNIAWGEVKRISFDPLNSIILYGRNQKLRFPRIMFANQNEIMEFIDRNLDLKKTTENKRWRDEDYIAHHYSRK